MALITTVGGIIGLILAVVFFVGLDYVLLFRSRDSNMPLVSRGTGMFLLAGILKVVFFELADHGSDVFNANFFNYALGAIAVVGVIVMMAGLAEGPVR